MRMRVEGLVAADESLTRFEDMFVAPSLFVSVAQSGEELEDLEVDVRLLTYDKHPESE